MRHAERHSQSARGGPRAHSWRVVVAAVRGLLLALATSLAFAGPPESSVDEAWKQSGADAEFVVVPDEYPGPKAAAQAAAAPIDALWGLWVVRGEWAWVYALRRQDSFSGLVVQGGRWDLGSFDPPSPISVRAFRLGDAELAQFDADVSAVLRRRVEVRRDRDEATRLPPRRRHWVGCGYRSAGGADRTFGACPGQRPMDENEARDFTVYRLFEKLVGAGTSEDELPDGSDAVEPILAAAPRLAPFMASLLVDWWGLHGHAVSKPTADELDAWARTPDDRDDRALRLDRARRGVSTPPVAIGSEAWERCLALGPAGMAVRWRAHHARRADAPSHCRALASELSKSFVRAMDAAVAVRQFGYETKPEVLQALPRAPALVRWVVADTQLDQGATELAKPALADLVASAATTWDPAPIWWGRCHWYLRALRSLARLRDSELTESDWDRVLRQTSDPVVALAAAEELLKPRGGPQPDRFDGAETRLRKCLERALAAPGGAIAVGEALEYGVYWGDSGWAWISDPVVAGLVDRALREVLADPRLPFAHRSAIRAMGARRPGK